MFLQSTDQIVSLGKIAENIFKVLSLGFKEHLTECDERVMDETSTKS